MRKIKKRIDVDNSTLILMEEDFENILPDLEDEMDEDVKIDVDIFNEFPLDENGFIELEGAFLINLDVKMTLPKKDEILTNYFATYALDYKVMNNFKLTEDMADKEKFLNDKLMTKILKRAESSFILGGFEGFNLVDKIIK